MVPYIGMVHGCTWSSGRCNDVILQHVAILWKWQHDNTKVRVCLWVTIIINDKNYKITTTANNRVLTCTSFSLWSVSNWVVQKHPATQKQSLPFTAMALWLNGKTSLKHDVFLVTGSWRKIIWLKTVFPSSLDTSLTSVHIDHRDCMATCNLQTVKCALGTLFEFFYDLWCRLNNGTSCFSILSHVTDAITVMLLSTSINWLAV